MKTLPPQFTQFHKSQMNTGTIITGSSSHRELIDALFDDMSNDDDVVIAYFNKWHQDTVEGFYIRDLETVVEIIDLMIDRYLTRIIVVFEQFLSLCAKPLMELKANERLSAVGMERIDHYFAKLSCFWPILNSAGKIKLGKCFRCIANGGKDPSMLRSDYEEWQPDGQRLKVTDKKFVQFRMRESEALDSIVGEFLNATDLLNYTTTVAELAARPPKRNRFDSVAGFVPLDAADFEEEEDLEQYGVPKNFGKPGYVPNAPDDHAVILEESSLAELSMEEGREDGNFTAPRTPARSPKNGGSPAHGSPTRGNSILTDYGGGVGGGGPTSPYKKESPAISRDLSQVMLDLCLELSVDPENANTMCILGICDGAIEMIEKDFKFNPREDRISFSIELLWNALEFFLEHAKQDNIDDAYRRYLLKSEIMLDLNRSVDALQNVLNYRLHEGYRLSDKELRNEVLIILTMLAEFPSTAGCIMRCGLFPLLITYACVEEMGPKSWPFYLKNVAKARNFATSSDIDLEFKKTLWFLVSACLRSNDPDALLCFGSSPMLANMLQYIEFDSFDAHSHGHHGGGPGNNSAHGNSHVMDGMANDLQQMTFSMASGDQMNASSTFMGGTQTQNNNNKTFNNNSITSAATQTTNNKKKVFLSTLPLSKLRELQLLAITFLVHNAPRVLTEFERLDGPAKVVTLTLKYYRSDVAEHKSLIFNALILLNRCLINSLNVRRFMNDCNLIQTFLFLFSKSDHEETRSQAVRLISSLCSNHNALCQQQLRSLDGIPCLIVPLQQYVRNRKPLVGSKSGITLTTSSDNEQHVIDPLENPFGGEISILVVAILDCFSNAVVGNSTTEEHFADSEGIDALLDLLETAPFVLRIQVLRLISNVLINPRLVSYTNAWRSPKTLRSAAQILCHCWLDEEVRLNGERTENGVICDIYSPFGNHQWPAALVNPPVVQGAIVLETYPSIVTDNYDNQSPNNNNNTDLTGQVGFGTMSSTLFNTSALTPTNGGAAGGGNNLGRSVTVSKLATAILAGRNATQTNLPIDVCEQALQKDTRVIIAAALQCIGVYEMYNVHEDFNPLKQYTEGDANNAVSAPESPVMLMPSVDRDGAAMSPAASSYDAQGGDQFDAGDGAFEHKSSSEQQHVELYNEGENEEEAQEGEGSPNTQAVFQSSPDLGLTPRDRQVLSMARKYSTLRAGDWWQDVKSTMAGSGVVPIESDRAWMDLHLERAFDAAQAVQLEQMELYDEDQRNKMHTEVVFIDQILVKKTQQIKAEWLKRNAKMKGTAAGKTMK